MAWWIFSKFRKLKREDVVDALIKLEQEEAALEKSIDGAADEIAALTTKGKAEKSRDMRLFYAKKINFLKQEKERNIKRCMYIMYNNRLLNQLKQAIDDNTFFANTGKVSLNNLLADQKNLARFLNKALGTRVKAEDVLTNADETFKEVEAAYDENETIYGVGDNDDALLAMFETEETADMEGEIADAEAGRTTPDKLTDAEE